MMTFDELYQAVKGAREDVSRADLIVSQNAELCVSRLRISGVDHRILCKLKRELRAYNMHTGRWEDS